MIKSNQDNRNIGEFLKQIAKQMNKSEKEIEPIIQKFKSNWLDTIDSLKLISKKEWDDLEIPLGLKHQILKNIGINHSLNRKKISMKNDMFISSIDVQVKRLNDYVYLMESQKKCQKIFSSQVFDQGVHKLSVKIISGYQRLGVGVMKLSSKNENNFLKTQFEKTTQDQQVKPKINQLLFQNNNNNKNYITMDNFKRNAKSVEKYKNNNYKNNNNDYSNNKNDNMYNQLAHSELIKNKEDFGQRLKEQQQLISEFKAFDNISNKESVLLTNNDLLKSNEIKMESISSSISNKMEIQKMVPFLSYHFSNGVINYKNQKNIATGKILDYQDTLLMFLDLQNNSLCFGKEEHNENQFFKGKCTNVTGVFQIFIALEPNQQVQVSYKQLL